VSLLLSGGHTRLGRHRAYQHGFNINKVGWILMLVGAIGAVLSVIVMVAGNTRRRKPSSMMAAATLSVASIRPTSS